MTDYVTMIHIKSQRLDVRERMLNTPSPSKNLSDQAVIPPIGRTNSFHRTITNLSLQLEDIRLEKKSRTEFLPKPIENTTLEKQKTVHFDQYVRVR